MRSLDFGQGDAATEIPDDWVSSVDERGTAVANRPDQDAVFLWLSTGGILGGKYAEEHSRKSSLQEVLSYSGDMAHQMEDLPDAIHV